MLQIVRNHLHSAAVAVIGLGLLLAAADTQARQDYSFRVLLDDREIGFHRFQVTQSDGRETVDIEANFKVTFFAIPFYRYDHSNQEIWRDGCLESIRSQTDDNGDNFRVEGQRDTRGFDVLTQTEPYSLERSCVMTFAYWNMDMLEQRELLNAQTGEYLPIEVDYVGDETLELNGGPVRASRYELSNSEQQIDITVWYETESGRWLSLESRVDGRVIRYLPRSTETVAALAADTGPPAKLDAVR